MATAISNPQPLNSMEIREGITVRICAALPENIGAQLKDSIYKSLGNTCSLNSSMYSKFSAVWSVNYRETPKGLKASWWIDYKLDDFGRQTVGGIGGNFGNPETLGPEKFSGSIEEMPPDKFRRETKQPIPAPEVIKKPDPNQVGMSQARKGPCKRRDV